MLNILSFIVLIVALYLNFIHKETIHEEMQNHAHDVAAINANTIKSIEAAGEQVNENRENLPASNR